MDEKCPTCGEQYVNIGHPLKPGVIMMRTCGCRYESVMQGTTTITTLIQPGQRVQDLECRLCKDPCYVGLVTTDPVTGRFELFPGWCLRHAGDITRPLTTPVDG